jgi:hypothetical protein
MLEKTPLALAAETIVAKGKIPTPDPVLGENNSKFLPPSSIHEPDEMSQLNTASPKMEEVGNATKPGGEVSLYEL